MTSLGYSQARFNVKGAAREIDIDARHRYEQRRLLAECKATGEKIGGPDINKFAGVVDAERRQNDKVDIAAYFVSLSGFTGEVRAAEESLRRMTLLSADDVLKELIHSRVLVSASTALATVSRAAALAKVTAEATEPPEILLSHAGWHWVFWFSSGRQRTHFAVVHADGTHLATEVASAYAATLEAQALRYLPPHAPSAFAPQALETVRASYLRFLELECGEIEIAGIPADREAGTRQLRLERLFVPMHLEPMDGPSRARVPVSRVLETGALAIVGAPGCGKSTLLNRLAVAYAFPEKRAAVDDALPERECFPLVVRCRHLEQMAKWPITEVLGSLANRAELGGHEAEFQEIVGAALRDGKALLLIDGLDEIADEGLRTTFARQLRLFLATYPKAGLVLSSREAGYRAIAGLLASFTTCFRVSEFNAAEITRLCVAWHEEMAGRSGAADGRALAHVITTSDRLARLARNPLLLMTLLLVKRWVGQLPTKRSLLYQKAIEVLLMTWNTEAYESLELDEAIPLLAYVALEMMKRRVQRLSHASLVRLLEQARAEMPDVLRFSNTSPASFVRRVELRSSILMLSGHAEEDGSLQAFYEFRHLTFQEYLAAIALVHGYYASRREDEPILNVVTPMLLSPDWKEVIPLVAVLLGRSASSLVKHIKMAAGLGDPKDQGRLQALELLGQFVIDEVQMPPEQLAYVLNLIAHDSEGRPLIERIASGRYGGVLAKSLLVEASRRGDDASVDLLCFAVCRHARSQMTPGAVETVLQAVESVASQNRPAVTEMIRQAIDAIEEVLGRAGAEGTNELSAAVGRTCEAVARHPQRTAEAERLQRVFRAAGSKDP
ncbi:MAG: NACHT domain-containing protein [Deltaproteobacteria bacterium]|nr:NACHT domain-containing protein [Deltaproteobacteria bacterium]